MGGYYIETTEYREIPHTTYDGIAVAITSLPGSGYYSFSVPATVAGVVVGYSDGNVSNGYGNISRGFWFSGGRYRVVEQGAFKTAPIPYSSANIFIIARLVEDGVGSVRYYIDNGTGPYTTVFGENEVPGLLAYSSTIVSNTTVVLKASLLLARDSVSGMSGPTVWDDYVFVPDPGNGYAAITLSAVGAQSSYAFGVATLRMECQGSDLEVPDTHEGNGIAYIGPLASYSVRPPAPGNGYSTLRLAALGRGYVDGGQTHIYLASIGYGDIVATKYGTILLPNIYTETIAPQIASQHSTTIFYSVGTYHNILFAAAAKIAHSHVIESAIKSTDTVYGSHEIEFSGEPARVSASHTLLFESLKKVAAAHEIRLYGLESVIAVHEIVQTIRSTITQSIAVTLYSSYSIAAAHETTQDILTTNPVKTTHSAFWSVLDGRFLSITTPTTLRVGQREVYTEEILISQGEGDVLWSVDAIISYQEDYLLFFEGVEFVVDLFGDEYVFIFTGKGITRNAPGEVSMRVQGASKPVALQSPRAETEDFSFAAPTEAETIIETILKEQVEWRMPYWIVPANRVEATDAIPLELASSLLQEVGAILECNPDGTMYVRKKYERDPTKYTSETPDQIYTDILDNLSVSEQYEHRLGYNVFRISELTTDPGDRLEFVEDDGSSIEGTLRAYPWPWRTSFSVLPTDTSGEVSMGAVLWKTREEKQTVEFTEGNASLSYPIDAIVSVVWLSEPLGVITFDRYLSRVAAPQMVNEGYGLATITYTVTCAEYRVRSADNTTIQFIFKED